MNAKTSGGSDGAAIRALLLGLVFFASGASGLVYEVAWSRTLRLVVGSTTLSHTIVLTAFMGGLALGSWVAGRRIDRVARPLRVYGVLELAIGAYGLLLPFLVSAASPLLGALYRSCEGRPGLFAVGELLLLGPIVLPGSALMGATLPTLGRAVTRSSVAREGGWLYAVNTLGASAGAALSGFVIMPALGLMATTLVAAITNGALAVAVFAIAARWPEVDSPPSTDVPGGKAPEPAPQAASRLATESRAESTAALAVALTGLAGMTLQIVWTKLFVTSVGSSTFAFTGVVAVYIVGIGAGAALGTRLLGLARPAVLLAVAALASALGAAFTVPFFAWLPTHVAELTSERISDLTAGSLAPLVGHEMLWLLVGLGPATLFLGATFPLGVAAAGGSPRSPGRALARVSTASSLGSIVGALLGGLVLLPSVGLSNTLRVAALLMGVAGLVAVAGVSEGSRVARRWPVGLAGLLVVLVVSLPGPGARLLDAGGYLFVKSSDLAEVQKRAKEEQKTVDVRAVVERHDKLLAHGEGEDLVAARYGVGYDEYLVINGKVDASSRADVETQLLLSHITLLIHGPGAKRVCVIGLGSGMSAGAALAYPWVERVDVVEISRTVYEIVKGSRLFDFLSHGALEDKDRTRLLLADGRTHIWNSSDLYDVIVSEPTNPWIAGVGDLYTTEHFEHLRQRLAPGGVVGQWLQGYSTTPELFRTIVRTFRGVFPDCQIWRFAQGEDFLLVAGRDGGDLTISLAQVQAVASANPKLAESLAEADVFSPGSLEWYFALDVAGVKEIAGEGPKNTDDLGFLEYHAPAALFQDAFPLDDPRAVELARSARSPFLDADPDELARIRALREDYYKACRLRRYEPDPDALRRAEAILGKIVDLAPPPATFVKAQRSEVLAERLLRGEIKGDEAIRDALARMAEVPSRSPRVLASYAKAAWEVGEVGLAESAYRRVLELRPFWDEGRTRLATILAGRRAFPEALEVLAGVEEPSAESLGLQGTALAGLGKSADARTAFERAVALDPRAFKAWIGLGKIKGAAKDLAGAREAFERAAACEPKAAGVWFNVALASYQLHDLPRAREACAKALEVDPRDERALQLRAELGSP